MSNGGISSPAAESQLLSASIVSQSRSLSKQLQQTYKQASQLFLTRRLQEALSVIEPLITPSSPDESNGNGTDTTPSAPIASASSNLKIKVWNLYITLLSSIIDLGPEEGKKEIGQSEWKSLAAKVRDGEIWDTVVKVGYHNREGSVDADVVYNLATLLLNHSPTQTLNQERLENYLASYGLPDLDVAAHIQNTSPGRRKRRIASSRGADTPKDLTIRVRLLELFTLHVLPRNGEWEYAREFINLSEFLDDERKETFLQTLDGLQEAKEQDIKRAAELQKEKEEELERQRKQQEEEEEEARRKLKEQQQRAAEAAKSSSENKTQSQKQVSAEVDYGIEQTNPNGSLRYSKSAIKPSSRPESSKQAKRTERPKSGPLRQFNHMGNLLIMALKRMALSATSSPLSLLRVILFLLGVFMALGRPDVRERIRRITSSGWEKIRGTVGMGMKVSYI